MDSDAEKPWRPPVPSTNHSTKAKGFNREGTNMSMSWNHAGAGQAGTMGIEYLDGLYSYALVLTRNARGGGSFETSCTNENSRTDDFERK
jgi:hypothetical protein